LPALGYLHAPFSSEFKFVRLLHEEVARSHSQVRQVEALKCVQSPPGLRGGGHGAASQPDPRTGVHHLLVPRPVDHLHGVVSAAMLHVLRVRVLKYDGLCAREPPLPLSLVTPKYTLGSRMDKMRKFKLPGTAVVGPGLASDAYVEARVGNGCT
jgi:hypothetical protein